jgi:hypothetical protein
MGLPHARFRTGRGKKRVGRERRNPDAASQKAFGVALFARVLLVNVRQIKDSGANLPQGLA